MMEDDDVEQSGDDIDLSVRNNPVDMKTDMASEEVTEDKKDIEEIARGGEEEGEEEEEEDEEDEEETESEEDTDDELANKLEPEMLHVEVSLQKKHNDSSMHPDNVTASLRDSDMPLSTSVENNVDTNQKPALNDENGSIRPDTEEGNDTNPNAYDSFKDRRFGEDNMSKSRYSSKGEHTELKNEVRMKEGFMDEDGRNSNEFFRFDSDTSGGGESGTEEEQVAFMRELDKFHKQKSLDFRPPKFYGGPLNLLKLWRAVVKLGGYDKVTACKYWRQVGESFNPPKTCTTISWTFRIFYEKALLDYERYRASIDGSSIPGSFAVTVGAENQASGSGRARRESAARAMQGWHSQRILDNGEVSDPIIKDKNSISSTKKEKQLKNLGIPKRKKSSSVDLAIKPARTKLPKTQTETTVIDIGSPADWVKINVRETKDCYEVYALVPGLLREEVRVQSDPAGRLVISGEPENPDNPWSVTPFKKVVSLPSRIDPHQTSAVVTLHGQLFVRVPFEQYD